MIGRKIKEARSELGISQKQLAGDDITRAYISIIEQGHAKPSEKILRVIAQKLGKPLEYFLGDHLEDNIEICDAILERARLKISQGEHEMALSVLNKVFPMTQDSRIITEAYLLSFEIYMESNDFQKILDIGEGLKDVFIKQSEKIYLVNYYMIMGKASFKKEFYNSSRKYYALALTYSSHLKKLQYERIQCLIYLGTIYVRLGEFENAIINYENAATEASVTVYIDLIADINLGLGKAYFLTSLNDKAIICTKKAIDLYEKDSNEDYKVYALHNLVLIENAIGDVEEAIDTLKMCYEIYKSKHQFVKQASVLEELAILSFKVDKVSESKNYCNEAIKLLELEEDGILRACLYRLMGVILHVENNLEQSYYLLRMSYDLLIRIQSDQEASISFSLLEISDGIDIKKEFLKKYK